MNKYGLFFILGVSLTTTLSSLAMAEDLVVVVNKANPVTDVTAEQLKKLILGQQSTWSSGKKVSVVLRSPGQPERDGLLRSACGMSENDYNQFTMHADLNGQTLGEPKVLPSPSAVRQSVGNNPGAIGFLRPSDLNDTVKAISVNGVPAGKPGYKVKTAD